MSEGWETDGACDLEALTMAEVAVAGGTLDGNGMSIEGSAVSEWMGTRCERDEGRVVRDASVDRRRGRGERGDVARERVEHGGEGQARLLCRGAGERACEEGGVHCGRDEGERTQVRERPRGGTAGGRTW